MGQLRFVLLLISLLVFAPSLLAQDNFVRSGLVRAQLTISPSLMLSEKASYYYLHGNLEGYVTEKLSFAGEVYYNVGSSAAADFNFNHSLFFGASWHWVKRRNDFYLGIQPGISISKLNDEITFPIKSVTAVNPLASMITGYNLYLNNFFHFFLQLRFVHGNHNYNVHRNLDELRFSGGLGFNLNTVRKK